MIQLGFVAVLLRAVGWLRLLHRPFWSPSLFSYACDVVGANLLGGKPKGQDILNLATVLLVVGKYTHFDVNPGISMADVEFVKLLLQLVQRGL